MPNSDKWNKLAEWMEKLHINEDELIEKFIIGSGRGGQKLHKTASTVYLKPQFEVLSLISNYRLLFIKQFKRGQLQWFNSVRS